MASFWSSTKYPPRFSIHWWFLLYPVFTMMLQNGDFPASASPPHLPASTQHSTLSKRPSFSSPIYLLLVSLVHIFSMVYNSLLNILVFKLSLTWSLGFSSSWFLGFVASPTLFLKHFRTFRHNMFQTHLASSGSRIYLTVGN